VMDVSIKTTLLPQTETEINR